MLQNLPEQITNNYYIPLAKEQKNIHDGLSSLLLSILNKKINNPEKTKEVLENGHLFLNSLMQATTNNEMSIDKR